MKPEVWRAALYHSLPIFVFHVTLGSVLGLLFHDAGYPWYVAVLFSLCVYAGSVQLLALSFLMSGGSLCVCILSLLVIAIRNVFYGLTMLERYEKIPLPLKFYLAHGLTDGVFSVLQISPKFEDERSDRQFIVSLTFLSHFSWVLSTLLGGYIGKRVPMPPDLEFAMTAFFAAAAVEIFLKQRQKRLIVIASVSLACALLIAPQQLMLPGILCAVIGCLVVPGKKEVKA